MTTAMKTVSEALELLATSTLANALDRVGCTSQTFVNLKPVKPGMRFVGPAMTVRQESGPFGTFESEDFKVGAMIDAADPGAVIVVAADGAPYSTWGGMASLAAATKGIAGVAIDGGARDADETADAEFSVYSRYLVPTTGRHRLKVADIGGTVTADGVLVHAGDWLVADDTGILSVPAAVVDDVIALAIGFTEEDRKAEEAIKSGLSFSEAMKKFGNI